MVKWIHFTDLHFSYPPDKYETDYNDEHLRSLLLKYIEDIMPNQTNIDFIVIAGDCVDKGNYFHDKVEDTKAFIADIQHKLNVSVDETYIVPGNHDLIRSDKRFKDVENFWTDNENVKKPSIDDETYQKFITEFGSYFRFANTISNNRLNNLHNCFERERYRILCVNTCLLSSSDHDAKKLLIRHKSLDEAFSQVKDDKRINIVLMHHGSEYLTDFGDKTFQQMLQKHHVDLVCCGHSHRSSELKYGHTVRHIYQFTCGAIKEDDFSQPSFYIYEYDPKCHGNKIVCTPHYFSRRNDGWSEYREGSSCFPDKGQYSVFIERKGIRDSIQKSQHTFTTAETKRFGISKALTLDEFLDERKKLLQSAVGRVVIAGQSLKNAFPLPTDEFSNANVSDAIIGNNNISELNIFLSDPFMFDCKTRRHSPLIEEMSDTPLKRIAATMEVILDKIIKDLPTSTCVNVFFIPLVQLDHIVMANDTLLLRNTLLWNSRDDFKTTPLMCHKLGSSSSHAINDNSMFAVYANYITWLIDNSIEIQIEKVPEKSTRMTESENQHRNWRNKVYDIRKQHNDKHVKLFRMYRKQLISKLHSTWNSRFGSHSPELNWRDVASYTDADVGFFPCSKGDIKNHNDLYKPNNLLGDNAQKVLLPYIKETEKLLNQAVQRYDKDGVARIFPSLDLGFPNNTQRLAGGFATGMLIAWKCGTPFVPVDTTVNVCSSSYCVIQPNGKALKTLFSDNRIDKIITKASKVEGLAFSFNSGNHFVLLCKSNRTGKLYLMLHSSAKQFKDHHLGLYPNPNNWFYDKLKTYKDKESGRYIRYLKDDMAEKFISIARHLNLQNQEIHEWFAKEFLEQDDISLMTRHHYGMPTDNSIAIGTYVLTEKSDNNRKNDKVPIFSRIGAPIILFRPNSQMWSIELEGKRKHIVPHGWGQTLKNDELLVSDDAFAQFLVDYEPELQESQLLVKLNNNVLHRWPINPKARITVTSVRDMFGGRDISKISEKDFEDSFFGSYLHGEIRDLLWPIAIFSKDSIEETDNVLYFCNENDSLDDVCYERR